MQEIVRVSDRDTESFPSVFSTVRKSVEKHAKEAVKLARDVLDAAANDFDPPSSTPPQRRLASTGDWDGSSPSDSESEWTHIDTETSYKKRILAPSSAAESSITTSILVPELLEIGAKHRKDVARIQAALQRAIRDAQNPRSLSFLDEEVREKILQGKTGFWHPRLGEFVGYLRGEATVTTKEGDMLTLKVVLGEREPEIRCEYSKVKVA